MGHILEPVQFSVFFILFSEPLCQRFCKRIHIDLDLQTTMDVSPLNNLYKQHYGPVMHLCYSLFVYP